MFKVICILTANYSVTHPESSFPIIEVGSILTVVEIEDWYDDKYYIFEEIASGFSYCASLFAPLDGPDELEIASARMDAEFADILQNA